MTFSATTLQEGGAVTIQVTGYSPPAGQQIQVVTPYNCAYRANYTTTGSTHFFTYPSASFVPTTSTRNSGVCYRDSNTFISRSPTIDTYRAEPIAGQSTGAKTFSVTLMPDKGLPATFTRTDRIRFVSKGHDALANVTFQLDAPQRSSYRVAGLQANDQGWVFYNHTLEPGWNDTNNPDADLGAAGNWTARVIDWETRGKAGDDSVRFKVSRTTIQINWTYNPPLGWSVQRTNFTGAQVWLRYVTSVPGQVPRNVTDQDFRGRGNQIQVDIVRFTGTNSDCTAGGTAALKQGDTGSFVKSPANSTDLNRWRMDFQSLPSDALGTYRIVIKSTNDTYGNLFPTCLTEPGALMSNGFDLVSALIKPVFTVRSAEVRRADLDAPLDLDLQIQYPSKTNVNLNEFTKSIKLQLYQGGQAVPNKFYEPADSGSGTRLVLSGLAGVVPPSTPLGPVQLRFNTVEGARTDRYGNLLDTTVSSPPIVVSPSAPRIVPNFQNEDGPSSAFGRPEQIRVAISVRYPDGTLLRDEDVGLPGNPSRGHAIMYFKPPDGTRRNFPLVFNLDRARFPDQWMANYTTQATDPVGVWDVVISVRDQYENSNVAPAAIRVGLVIKPTLSSTQIHRAENLSISAEMNRPGSQDPETGQVTVTIRGGGQTMVNGDSMRPTPQGTYTYTWQVPHNAPLGTYDIRLAGTSGSGLEGLEITNVTIISTGIQVVNPRLSSTNVARLESTSFAFRLEYPNGGPLTRLEINAPKIAAVSAAGTSVSLPVAYDSDSGDWATTFNTFLDTGTGEYWFLISGQDNTGNKIEDIRSRSFTVIPAEILITDLESHRTGYDRGEFVRLQADARYADGSLVVGVEVPVDVMAGAERRGIIDLAFNSTLGRYDGRYQIKMSDPLSAPGAEWNLVVRADAVEDSAGNRGPTDDVRGGTGFAVRQAFLSVQFTELPATGLRIGKDQAQIRFVLRSGDGTPVNAGLDGLAVNLLRGTAVVANSTVTADEAGYSAVVPLSVRGLSSGPDYVFQVKGIDKFGNEIRLTTTEKFELVKAQDSPMMGFLGALAGLGTAFAVGRRRHG